MSEAFDTLAASEELRNNGLDDDQSKVIARFIDNVVTGNRATKDDVKAAVKDMKLGIQNLKLMMYATFAAGVVAFKALDYLLPAVGLYGVARPMKIRHRRDAE